MADTTGEADLRKEFVSPVVTGFALQSYIMKPLCTIVKSNAFEESYYQEDSAELTGGTGSGVKGIPRLAVFPYGEPNWTKQTKTQLKYGMEGVVSYEDKKMNNIDVIQRTLKRIARAVAKAVDDEVWDTISELRVGTLTNKVTITAGNEWDSATIANRNPIDNLLEAQQKIVEDNYDPYTQTTLLLSPKDFRYLLGNASVRNAGQFWTSDVTKTGKVGMLLNMSVKVTNSVTDDWAAVVIEKEAVTWQSITGLTTITIEEPGVHTIIRTWEMGVAQLKNPNAICLIYNTQK